MTKKQKEALEVAKQKIQACTNNGDTEIAHVEADNVLCDLLIAFGCEEVVVVFKGMDKWYS